MHRVFNECAVLCDARLPRAHDHERLHEADDLLRVHAVERTDDPATPRSAIGRSVPKTFTSLNELSFANPDTSTRSAPAAALPTATCRAAERCRRCVRQPGRRRGAPGSTDGGRL